MTKRIAIGDGMRFGMGVDSASDTVRGNSIDFDQIETGIGGQTVSSDVKLIESQEQLLERLNFTAAGSFNIALEASGDLKTQFAREHAVNDFSVYMLFQASVTNPPQSLVGARLRGDAVAIFGRDPDEFTRVFGDTYIDQIIGGGEFFGLFTFETHDEATKTEIGAELKISIGNFLEGGEVSAAFHDTISTISKRTTMEIRAIMSGGSGILNPQDLLGLQTIHKQFNAAVRDNPVNYLAVLKEYVLLPMPPGPTRFDVSVRRDCIESCGRRVVEAIRQRAQVEYVLAHPIEFIDPRLPDLSAALVKLDALMPRLGGRARDCSLAAAGDVANVCSLVGLEPVVVDIPARIKVNDQLGAKLEEIRAHDSIAALAFPELFQPKNFDTAPNGGRIMLFRNPDPSKNAPPVSGVFWHPAVDGGHAHVVYGAIFQKYRAGGMEIGPLGYPIEDEQPTAGPDRTQRFQNGHMFFDAKSGEVTQTVDFKVVLFPKDQHAKDKAATPVLGNIKF